MKLVPQEVLDIIQQDEEERTHEVYQPAKEGPFRCDHCIFANETAEKCAHEVIASSGRVMFQGEWYMGRNGQIEPAACCDFFKKTPNVRKVEPEYPVQPAKYGQSQIDASFETWANSGERYDKAGKRQADGAYARNILDLSLDRENHKVRHYITPQVVEVYGEPLQLVDPSLVGTGQTRLHVGRIRQYLDNPSLKPTKGPRGLAGGDIVICNYKGMLSVVDGNHRLSAAHMAGRKVWAIVVDMNQAVQDAREERKEPGENLKDAIARITVAKGALPNPPTTPFNKRSLLNPGLVGRSTSPHHVHHVADKHVEEFKRAVKHAFEVGRGHLNKHALRTAKTAALATTIVGDAIAKTADELARALPDLYEKMVNESGSHTMLHLWTKPRGMKAFVLKMRGRIFKDAGFDTRHPGTRKWIQDHTGELITGIDETTRKEIADLIEESFADDVPMSDVMDEIAALLGDDDRAALVARTETMTAANEGQRAAWDQAAEQGYLDGDEKRVWIVTDDDRLCEDCDALDGEETALDGTYPGDGEDGPPLHPDCRCTEGLA